METMRHVATTYTDKELRSEAVRAIRQDAKAARVRARCLGYSVRINQENGAVQLIAHGQRTDDSDFRFDVTVRI